MPGVPRADRSKVTTTRAPDVKIELAFHASALCEPLAVHESCDERLVEGGVDVDRATHRAHHAVRADEASFDRQGPSRTLPIPRRPHAEERSPGCALAS